MIRKILVGLLVLVVVLIGLPALYLGATLWRAHGGLPEWDADLAVAGLDGPVEILRDANGVADINTSTRRDAIFAQGVVHAQDRFWQMSLTRQIMAERLAERLAEWMGRPALDSLPFKFWQGRLGEVSVAATKQLRQFVEDILTTPRRSKRDCHEGERAPFCDILEPVVQDWINERSTAL